jgi:hypothetical protein
VTGKNRMVLYVEPLLEERDDRVAPHVWVLGLYLTRTKTGFKETARRRVELLNSVAAETTLHEWPEAAAWTGLNSAITFEQKRKAFEKIHDLKETLAFLLHQETLLSLMATWKLRSTVLSTGGYVKNPSFAIPIGVLRRREAGGWGFVCLSYSNPHALFYSLAEDPALKKEILKIYTGRYASLPAALNRMESEASSTRWHLSTVPPLSIPTSTWSSV